MNSKPEFSETWSPPDVADSQRAEVDLAWRQFGAAATPEEYCRSWLAVQCHIITEVNDAVVVLQRPGGESFAPLAFWPEDYPQACAELERRGFTEVCSIEMPDGTKNVSYYSGEGDRPDRAAPGGRGLDPKGAGHGAGGDAGEAAEALVRADPEEPRHREVRGARPRAQVAVDAGGRVARDLERGEERQGPEERAVGAQVAAPRVRDDHGEDDQPQDHVQREGREPLEEVQHLHVGDPVVGRVQEVGHLGRAHLEEDGPDEEGEKQVLERPQGQVEHARQGDLPAEEASRQRRERLRQRADRAHPRAEGLLRSSKWVHEMFPDHRFFGWQVKYGAFSVSVSQLDRTIHYIRTQPEHHRKMTFREEFLALLDKHRIAYDERYLWD